MPGLARNGGILEGTAAGDWEFAHRNLPIECHFLAPGVDFPTSSYYSQLPTLHFAFSSIYFEAFGVPKHDFRGFLDTILALIFD